MKNKSLNLQFTDVAMYKTIIRPLFFLFDPEEIHYFTFKLLKNFSWISSMFKDKIVEDPRLEREVFGLKFKNPVGLAAGFDKDAKLFQELSDLGFGFIEIGTLTPKPKKLKAASNKIDSPTPNVTRR
mgnify:CR=1 FL=1